MVKRKRDNSSLCTREKPVQRNAANARERARMRVLSKAFCRLKTTLPWVPADTKLSKLDTLRLAASYIAHLRQILSEDTSDSSVIHPLNLTWPFTFNAVRLSDSEMELESGIGLQQNSSFSSQFDDFTASMQQYGGMD
uniref:BHLH domain-containing protein n=1 Tax=Strigamia maritima TaxID=126957 RepID=T1J087_STRMM